MGVRLPDDPVFIPDILLAEREPVLANHSGILDAADVHLVVEIVSPGSRTDRSDTKPVLYACADISPSCESSRTKDQPCSSTPWPRAATRTGSLSTPASTLLGRRLPTPASYVRAIGGHLRVEAEVNGETNLVEFA